MSSQLIQRIRDHLSESGLSRAAFARAVGMHPNSLRSLDEPSWNPTADTLTKFEKFLSGAGPSPLVPIEEIIEEARNGRMYILVDDEDRENEGDVIIPAQMATPDVINFMAKHARGLICLALSKQRIDQLDLPLMAQTNRSRHETAFTVSIEAREGVTTGISAADRARTIAVAIDSNQPPSAIVSPGHVFPLVARDGGVLVRAGHTEAAVDVSRLAGLNPSGVICEVMRDDGTMARMDDLMDFARTHGLKIGTIRDLIAYRNHYDHLVEKTGESALDSEYGGEWTLKTYVHRAERSEHLVLQKGRIIPGEPTLVRMHRFNPLTDLLGEKGPRCHYVQRAMNLINENGSGLLVILRDNMPDELTRFMTARETGEKVEPERRVYGIGAQILADLGVTKIVLLSNSSTDFVGLSGYNLDVVEQRRID